ncbi:hypothetical protein F5Y14DRAFT_389490 [Nemania sp. NC0429]|nr:hypothetical protein F5Y14DRAFT_389490 [Nemania sp. NC0429]
MKATPLAQGTKRRYSGEQTTREATKDKFSAAPGGGHAGAGAGLSHAQPASPRDHDAAVVPKSGSSSSRPAGWTEDYFRSLYSSDPDFYRLGLKDPALGALLKDGVHLDFTDPAAVMQLTKTLLHEDFGLRVHLPPNRLCPPVPNRHNYILWLKDLLDSTSSSYSEQYDPQRKVTGLDIGTGASLIYPLLGCIQREAWSFIATDIDAESLASARANARANDLESRIRIVDRTASDPLIPLDDLDVDAIDFTMANPPFYASDTELLELAAQKSQPPHSACTGVPVEMVCEGGEVAFVERMIVESLVLRGRVQWYTTMLGKQSSLAVLVEILRKHEINNFAVTTFIQGSKTRRWALGWSFLARRPSPSASRGCGSLIAKSLLAPTTAITIYEPSSPAHTDLVPFLKTILCGMMESLDLCLWIWDEKSLRGMGFAESNVWSRAYRRRRAREGVLTKRAASGSLADVANSAFGFSLSIHPAKTDDELDEGTAIILRWLQGDDAALFESFSGVIRRCLRKDAIQSDH